MCCSQGAADGVRVMHVVQQDRQVGMTQCCDADLYCFQVLPLLLDAGVTRSLARLACGFCSCSLLDQLLN